MSRQPSRARTLTQGINKDNGGAAEQGVRGRNIRVLHTSDFPHLDNGHADSSSSGSTTAVGVPDGILMAHSSTGPDM